MHHRGVASPLIGSSGTSSGELERVDSGVASGSKHTAVAPHRSEQHSPLLSQGVPVRRQLPVACWLITPGAPGFCVAQAKRLAASKIAAETVGRNFMLVFQASPTPAEAAPVG
jgi:hypothetical protein